MNNGIKWGRDWRQQRDNIRREWPKQPTAERHFPSESKLIQMSWKKGFRRRCCCCFFFTNLIQKRILIVKY